MTPTTQKNKFLYKDLENHIRSECEILKRQGITNTQPGTLKHLMYGPEPSGQSTQIKMGKIGEEMPKIIIIKSPDIELLKCGVQPLEKSKKNKDLDLIWKNETIKTIYYREVKANMDLDSEKIEATINKVNEVKDDLVSKYSAYTIDIGIFNWSIYNRKVLKKTGLSQIKKCEKNGIKVDHPEDLFKLLDFVWDEESYYSFFNEIGKFFRE